MRHRAMTPTAFWARRWVAAGSVTLMVLSALLLTSALRTLPHHPRAEDGPHLRPSTAAPSTSPAGHRPSAGPVTAVARVPSWRTVLVGLDRHRARAYATLDVRALGAVYAPGSAVLRADRALLRRYRDRGLRVRGLRVQVSALRVRTAGPDRVVLAVRDRIVAGTVVGGGRRRPLPPDHTDTRAITLQRAAGAGWRISRVLPA